ncbi:MAG: SRPBCC domain-containing protein, partial [Terriglobales bacterium]
LVWKAWTDPKYVMQWWGPKGFTAPVCKMDFRVGGKSLLCMRMPDGQECWNAVEYHEIVPLEKIVSSMHFSDPLQSRQHKRGGGLQTESNRPANVESHPSKTEGWHAQSPWCE